MTIMKDFNDPYCTERQLSFYLQMYARSRREDPLRNMFNALFKYEESITQKFGFVSEV